MSACTMAHQISRPEPGSGESMKNPRVPSGSPPAPPRRLVGRAACWALALAFCVAPVATPAAAQDFMFRQPGGWLRVDAGMNFAAASSDIFDEYIDLLTLDRGDFNAWAIGGAAGLRLSDRVDLVMSGRFSRSSAQSEYREYVDQDDFPIVQQTRLSILPLTIGPRYNLKPAGRAISDFAYIPAGFVPYVGAAVGAAWYNFEQDGDFINFNDPDLPIFGTYSRSTGWFPTAHLFGGADIALLTRLALNLEARYAFGSAELDRTLYSGFEPIDLSGLWATIGLTVRL